MKKNLLLIIGKYYYPVKGGIENVTSFQEKIYRDYKDIHFIYFSNSKNSSNKIYFFKFISFFSQPISISLFYWLYKNLNNYEFLELHSPNPLVMFYLLILNKNTKIVIHYHSDIVNQKFLNFFLEILVKKTLSKSYFIISTSSRYVQFSNLLNKFIKKVRVIPPVLDNQRFKNELLTENIIKNKINILSVGRFVKYKGFEILIKAINYLPENYHLTLIGNGPLHNKFQSIINDLKLSKRINIINNANDDLLSKKLKECNVFVLPSINKSEAFGVVLLEALYFGRPLLTSNLFDSGVTEVNRENITGLYFEKLSSKDLSDKIVSIISELKKGNYSSKDLREYFDEYFSKEITKMKYYDLYNIIY